MRAYLTELRANAKLALPLITAQLAVVGMSATDTLFAGWLGPQALAAVAVGANVNAVPFVFFTGLFMAGSAIVSRRRGQGGAEDGDASTEREGDWPEVGAFARSLLLLALVSGLIWSGGLWLAAPYVIAPLRLSPETTALATDYLRCYGLSGVGLTAWFALRYCAEGLASSKPVMAVGLFGLVLNALLNWLLIYGAGPIPALGVKGSGLATALASLAMALAMLGLYAGLPRLRRVRLFEQGREVGGVGTTLKLGLPIGATLLAEAGLFVFVSAWMARLGEGVVAAHQIALNVASVLFMIPLGLALATTVRVAYFHGANDAVATRRAAFAGIGLSVGTALFNAALMGFGSMVIARLYTADPVVAAQAAGFLLLAATFQVFDGVQVTAGGALRGLHDTRTPLLITLAAYWLIGVPAAAWLVAGLGLGPSGLWLGLNAGLAAAAVGLTLRLRRATRIRLR